MSPPLFVIRDGYRAEWKPAGERPVEVCCRVEMFDPGPIIGVTGPGITGELEFSANAYEGLDQSDILKIQQLEQAAYGCAKRFAPERDPRIIARDGSYWIAAQDVREGDLLDFEGDSIADPTGCNPDFMFEYATAESVEHETENCVRVDTDQGSYGFPTGHLIETTLDSKTGEIIP